MYRKLLLTIIFSSILLCLISCESLQSNDPNLIRIGVQSALPGQAQVVQVLKNTDILKDLNLKAEFIEFSSGPPLVESALARKIDVITAGNVPIPTLILKTNNNWKVVFRNTLSRVSLLVPYNSKIHKFEVLETGLIGLPIGSASEKFVTSSFGRENLSQKKLIIVHLGAEEIIEIINSKGADDWDEYKAVSIWDPIVSVLEEKKLVKSLSEELAPTYTAFSNELLTRDSGKVAERFKQGWIKAWEYYLNNVDQADAWYIKNSIIAFDKPILNKVFNMDPRQIKMRDSHKVDLSLDEFEMQMLKTGLDFVVGRSGLNNTLTVEEMVTDQSAN